MKIIHYIIICFLILPIGLACQEVYLPNENVTVYDVIETAGVDAVCNITLYHNYTIISNATMQKVNLSYNHNFGLLEKGSYYSIIECDKTGDTYLGECEFIVEEEGSMYTAIGIILIFGVIFLLYIGKEFKFLFLEIEYGKENKQVMTLPFLQYLFWIVAGWLVVGILNIPVVLDYTGSLNLTGTVGVIYKSVLTLMVFLSIFWVIGFLFYVFQWLAARGDDVV